MEFHMEMEMGRKWEKILKKEWNGTGMEGRLSMTFVRQFQLARELDHVKHLNRKNIAGGNILTHTF